jgi:thymidylate kinase
VKSSGLFITFEGLNGSGKTTQMHRHQQATNENARSTRQQVVLVILYACSRLA